MKFNHDFFLDVFHVIYSVQQHLLSNRWVVPPIEVECCSTAFHRSERGKWSECSRGGSKRKDDYARVIYRFSAFSFLFICKEKMQRTNDGGMAEEKKIWIFAFLFYWIVRDCIRASMCIRSSGGSGQFCVGESARARNTENVKRTSTEKLEKCIFCWPLVAEHASEWRRRCNRCWRFCKTDCTLQLDMVFLFHFVLMDPSRWPLQLSADASEWPACRWTRVHDSNKYWTTFSFKPQYTYINVFLVIFIMRHSLHTMLFDYIPVHFIRRMPLNSIWIGPVQRIEFFDLTSCERTRVFAVINSIAYVHVSFERRNKKEEGGRARR